jgi:NADH-quinone oxidoreductase subunit G
LKETKSFCTSCATGCNTLIGTRQDVIYRQTPRENDAVNSCWMCDYGRLNFGYLEAPERLLEPQMFVNGKLAPSPWETVIRDAATQLRQFAGRQIAILASGRMTNEELWLTSRFAKLLGIELLDILPRSGPGDEILLSEDRNPNTNGAKLILGLTSEPGEKLAQIAGGIASGEIRALIAFGEDPLKLAITAEQLAALPTFIAMDILKNESTPLATAVFPSFGFAEKRGSMINRKGRLQRLNRAVAGPGAARDDWEILRDLIQACTEQNGIYSIEDVFREMSAAIPQFAGLNLSKIGDLGVQVLDLEREMAPGEPAKEKVKRRETEKASK